MMTVLGSGILLLSTSRPVEAGHGCRYGGYSYAVPDYSYAPTYSYAAPVYSYGPSYQSAYLPSYGYSTGISIGFGHGHHSVHGGHFSGHGNHWSGHGGHHGGGHYGSHHGHHSGHH
jgi:hypothetical protein